MYYWNSVNVEELLGKTLLKVEQNEDPDNYSDSIHFYFTDGSEYVMLHQRDCCESVYIESVNGSWDELIGDPLLEADERRSHDEPPPGDPTYIDSYTWTFYRFATVRGYVVVRWFGTSNGYYGESASVYRVDKEN